jgi:hypothetical protein
MAWMSFSTSAALFGHPARYPSSLLYINVAFHVFFTSLFQISRFSLQIEQINYLFTLVFAWALSGAQSHQLGREVDVERTPTGMGMQLPAKGGFPLMLRSEPSSSDFDRLLRQLFWPSLTDRHRQG